MATIKVYNVHAGIDDMDADVTIRGLYAESEEQARAIVALYFPRMEVISVEEVDFQTYEEDAE